MVNINKFALASAVFAGSMISVPAMSQDLPIRDDDTASASVQNDANGEAAAAEGEEAREVCRSMQITGTRRRQRVCMSEAEWNDGREATLQVSMEMRRTGEDRQESDANGPIASPQ